MPQSIPKTLRNEWLLSVGVATAMFFAWVFFIDSNPTSFPDWPGRLLGLLVFAAVPLHLRLNLAANVPTGQDGPVRGHLGLPNWITLLRGWMVCWMTVLWLVSEGSANMAWAAGGVYAGVVALDWLDGALARLRRQTTRLGEILDMDWDSFGMLAACGLAFSLGRAAWIVVLVGLARYLFLLGMRLLRWRGKPVYPLPLNPQRRLFAGAMMVFMVVALSQMFPDPTVRFASWLFALPVLAGFTLDWFLVSRGRLLSGLEVILKWGGWLLNLARLAVPVLAAILIFTEAGLAAEVRVALGLAGLLVGLGCLPRLSALFGLLLAGWFSLQFTEPLLLYSFLAALVAILLFGVRNFSLFTPEESWFYARFGE